MFLSPTCTLREAGDCRPTALWDSEAPRHVRLRCEHVCTRAPVHSIVKVLAFTPAQGLGVLPVLPAMRASAGTRTARSSHGRRPACCLPSLRKAPEAWEPVEASSVSTFLCECCAVWEVARGSVPKAPSCCQNRRCACFYGPTSTLWQSAVGRVSWSSVLFESQTAAHRCGTLVTQTSVHLKESTELGRHTCDAS